MLWLHLGWQSDEGCMARAGGTDDEVGPEPRAPPPQGRARVARVGYFGLSPMQPVESPKARRGGWETAGAGVHGTAALGRWWEGATWVASDYEAEE